MSHHKLVIGTFTLLVSIENQNHSNEKLNTNHQLKMCDQFCDLKSHLLN